MTQEQQQQQVYYWIRGESQGRTVILGWFSTPEEAQAEGAEKIGGYFDVVPLTTKDMRKATQILKAKKLDESHSLPYALERVKHKP